MFNNEIISIISLRDTELARGRYLHFVLVTVLYVRALTVRYFVDVCSLYLWKKKCPTSGIMYRSCTNHINPSHFARASSFMYSLE